MLKYRYIYIDYLRVFAMIAVVMLHVASQGWYDIDVRSVNWNLHNFWNGIVRWGVPIFVMISGSLFLSRNVDVRKLYKTNILKLLIVYIAWAVFYAIAIPLLDLVFLGDCEISLKAMFSRIVSGNYHMWFIPMIIGLYMCIPIIKEIVRTRSVTYYYVVLSVIFAYLIPQFVNIVNDFVGGIVAKGINVVYDVIDNDMNLHIVCGYAFYFILGYLLNNIELNKNKRVIIYCLGAVGYILTVVLNALLAYKTNEPTIKYFGNSRLNVLLEAVAIHTFFKYMKYDNEKINSVVSILAKYSFGVYLIHPFVIALLRRAGLDMLLVSSAVFIPVIALVVVLISFCLSWLLHRIPLVNKWVV